MRALPTVCVSVNGSYLNALVDSGSSRSLICERFASMAILSDSHKIMNVNAESVSCVGTTRVTLRVAGREVNHDFLVMKKLVPGFELIIGNDLISRLEGVTIGPDASVKFGCERPSASATVCTAADELKIEDRDFTAEFREGKWFVAWRWKDKAPILTNKIANYGIPPNLSAAFNEELENWVQNGWLQPIHHAYHGPIIPLIPIEQPAKGNVRPVLDFRQINQYVVNHTAHAYVCDETLRRWRQMRGKISMLDLKKAYLQLHVEPELWRYQVIQHDGQYYFLTRLGFGLSSAPRIMSEILRKVLSLQPDVAQGTDHFVDDLIVNENIVSVEKVIDHLKKYGLESKPAQPMESSKVLGLQLREEDGRLLWTRGKLISFPNLNFQQCISRRELFSICGQLIGHYPVAGWIRVGCGYIKRRSSGSRWDDDIGKEAKFLLQDLLTRVSREDPVHGEWNSPSPSDRPIRVWCDASSLAIGVVVQVGGCVVEDAAWLRKMDDSAHINVAELEAIIRGMNLAIKWNARRLEVVTDSATVKGWLLSVFEATRRAKAHGIAEMLVRRRLSILTDLIEEYDLKPVVLLVPSSQNKADSLTRVPSTWLKYGRLPAPDLAAVALDRLRASHCLHHFGVDRSMSIATRQFGEVSREEMEKVVKVCSRCRIIDPAPVRWKRGSLGVEKAWNRLAMDVTHFGSKIYLTIVDCGPGRFAIWRLIAADTAENICREVEAIFRERGPPQEILLDNSTSFRSARLNNLCGEWSVKLHFRCAYRPETNGIVERNHRTIKRMSARTRKDPRLMVYWYNVAERNPGEETTSPARSVHTYRWRMPSLVSDSDFRLRDEASSAERVVSRSSESEDDEEFEEPDTSPEKSEVSQIEESKPGSEFQVGERVVVRPPGARCTTEWKPAVVTRIKSESNLEVDGMPRHVSDLRHAPEDGDGIPSGIRPSSLAGNDGVQDYRVRLRPRTVYPNYRV